MKWKQKEIIKHKNQKPKETNSKKQKKRKKKQIINYIKGRKRRKFHILIVKNLVWWEFFTFDKNFNDELCEISEKEKNIDFMKKQNKINFLFRFYCSISILNGKCRSTLLINFVKNFDKQIIKFQINIASSIVTSPKLTELHREFRLTFS